MKLTKNFRLQEFIPKWYYEGYGDKGSIIALDNRIIATAQWVRDLVGCSMIINNWHRGGSRNWSGLRTRNSVWYNHRSQHSFGRAFDAVFSTDVDYDEVRARIAQDWPLTGHLWHITMEEGVSWLHVDVRAANRPVNFFKQ